MIQKVIEQSEYRIHFDQILTQYLLIHFSETGI